MATVQPDTSNETVSFGLEYDGPALAAHEMDVRDLARALLSTGDLFRVLNRTMNPGAPDVTVNVRATSEGSFIVDLRLLFELMEQGVLTRPIQAAGTLVGLVAGSAYLIELVKRRRHGREVSQEPSDDGMVRLTFADDTTLEIPGSVLQASGQVEIQRDLAEVVAPLAREGIERMTIRREAIVVASVEKDDVPAFATVRGTAAEPAPLAVTEREVFLTIRTAGFASGRWTFSDGASNFTAIVRDETFLSRVHSGESFSELDVLRCVVRETQTRDEKGLHSSVEILEVREHLPPAQGTLALEPPD